MQHRAAANSSSGIGLRGQISITISVWGVVKSRGRRVPHKDILKIYTVVYNGERFNSFHMRQIYARTDAGPADSV